MGIDQKSLGYVLVGFSVILAVLLIFVKIDLDNRGVFLCEAVSTSPDMDMSECPAHSDNSSWLIVGSFAIALLIFAIGIYLIFVPIKALVKKEEHHFKKIDTSKLGEEEKKIYDVLTKSEGSIYQSELIEETGFSKVHVTRVLDKMEGKQIIERKRRGMTNIVILR